MFIVAVDGTAGSGKSYLCKELAKNLKFIHFDSGIAYRSVGLSFLKQGLNEKNIKLSDAKKAIQKLTYLDIKKAISQNLQTKEITEMAKFIGSHKETSYAMIDFMRKLVKEIKATGFIVSGRNIQTEVFPKANVKIFLTASAQSRGNRRYLEMKAKGMKVNLKEITSDIIKRDENDMKREISPLKIATDSWFLDNTNINGPETVAVAQALIKARYKK